MLRKAHYSPEQNFCNRFLMQYVAILDMIYHLPEFAKVLIAAEPLEVISSENEKAAFAELKIIIESIREPTPAVAVRMQHFITKLMACNYSEGSADLLTIWQDTVKLIMGVIPPLREVFLGQVSCTCPEEVTSWMNTVAMCFNANFCGAYNNLEDIMRASVSQVVASDSSSEVIRNSNGKILKRAPEVLVFHVDSPLLRSAHSAPSSSSSKSLVNDKPPSVITFPESFDLCTLLPSRSTSSSNNLNSNHNNHHNSNSNNNSNDMSKWYDIYAVDALEGTNYSIHQTFFRVGSTEDVASSSSSSSSSSGGSSSDGKESVGVKWYRIDGLESPVEVSKSRSVQDNFYSASNAVEKRVHPRLLVYTRRDIGTVLARSTSLVTRAGQMRALGDVAFAMAMTTENYSEARRCYEAAIELDKSLEPYLQETLKSLEKIERTQRARSLEEQADIALSSGKYREASDLYQRSIRNGIPGSEVYVRVQEKQENMLKIIHLDTSCLFAEKGEEALRNRSFASARDYFSQAAKLNPEYRHLQLIIAGIDKIVQLHIVRQKSLEANQAMKAFRYRQAHQLLMEAIALDPDELPEIQPILDDLGPLIQSENALARQRLGEAAMEEKRYEEAIELFTEAEGLLPKDTRNALACLLCNRAQAHFEMKNIEASIADCHSALENKPDFPQAYLRLGMCHFALDQYDEANSCYEKALKSDPTWSEAIIKTKIRQVNTAKEVQQRKERELERERQKEEQKKSIEEKLAKDEVLKKEKAERMAKEKAEKAERLRIKEEEKKLKLLKEKEEKEAKEREKEAEKERLRKERAEKEALKTAERERMKVEKEKERERQRMEKEAHAAEVKKQKEIEAERQRKLQEERQKVEAAQREAERQKEAEKDAARKEMERIIAVREAARVEKLAAEAAEKARLEAEAKAEKESLVKQQSEKLKVEQPVKREEKASKKSLPLWSAAVAHQQPSAVQATQLQSPVPALTEIVGAPSALSPDSLSDFPPLLVGGSSLSSGNPAVSLSSVASPVGIATSTKKDIASLVSPPVEPSSNQWNKSTSAAAAANSNSSAWANHQQAQLIAANESFLVGSQQQQPGTGNVASNAPFTSPMVQPKKVVVPEFQPTPETKLAAEMGRQALLKERDAAVLQGSTSVLDRQPQQQQQQQPLLSSSNTSSLLGGFPSIQSASATSGLFGNNSSNFDPFTADFGGLNLGGESNFSSNFFSDNSTSRFSNLSGFGSQSSTGVSNLSSLNVGIASSFGAGALDLDDPLLRALGSYGVDSSLTSNDNNNSSLFGSSSSTSTSNGLQGLGLDLGLGLGLGISDDANSLGASLSSSLLSSLNTPFDLSGSSFQADSNSLFSQPSSSLPPRPPVGHQTLSQFSVESPLPNRFPSPSLQQIQSPFGGFTSASPPLLSRNQTPLVPPSQSSANNSILSSFPMSSVLPLTTSSPPLSITPDSFVGSSTSSSLTGSVPAVNSTATGEGLENDLLNENSFPCVAWLRSYGMHMYRWSGDNTEWTEYAMHLPRKTIPFLLGKDPASRVSDLQTKSQCCIWLDVETLRGQQETFLVFQRGSNGQISNQHMQTALEMISHQMKVSLQTSQSTINRQGSHMNGNPLDSQRSVGAATSGSTVWGTPASPASSSLSSLLSPNHLMPSSSVHDLDREDASQGSLSEYGDNPFHYLSRKPKLKRPELLKGVPVTTTNSGLYIRRVLEIPRDAVGVIIGHGGNKIKDLCGSSGAKIQFRVNKTAEKDGRPGMLEVQGTPENVDAGFQQIWDLLQLIGKEYVEIMPPKK